VTALAAYAHLQLSDAARGAAEVAHLSKYHLLSRI
jgi:hypothetical protein